MIQGFIGLLKVKEKKNRKERKVNMKWWQKWKIVYEDTNNGGGRGREGGSGKVQVEVDREEAEEEAKAQVWDKKDREGDDGATLAAAAVASLTTAAVVLLELINENKIERK